MSVIVEAMVYEDPGAIDARLVNHDRCFFLDSANHATPEGDRNRYSYIGIDPFLTCVADVQGVWVNDVRLPDLPALDALDKLMARYRLTPQPGLPPFQGGAIGYISYDVCSQLETIDLPDQDDMGFPLMVFAFYDVLISFDHQAQQAWWISNGLSAIPLPDDWQRGAVGRLDASQRDAHAAARLLDAKAWLGDQPSRPGSVGSIDEMRASETAASYQAKVRKTQAHIRRGDIFEANISQFFDGNVPDGLDHGALYQLLRALNPAPYAACFSWGEHHILSASPECFLKVDDGVVETRPIKGTRPRLDDADKDQQMADALQASQKDRAENVMIVDLMRNDLSRVCQPESVEVTQLCGLESFKSVHHLVSVVKGRLKAEASLVDLLRATFPGGSITGAPKIRAMSIISELEKERRGPYCGCLGYMGFDGCMQMSIVIRTILSNGRLLRFNVGGAVTLLSDPAEEYQETLDKAAGLRRALPLSAPSP